MALVGSALASLLRPHCTLASRGNPLRQESERKPKYLKKAYRALTIWLPVTVLTYLLPFSLSFILFPRLGSPGCSLIKPGLLLPYSMARHWPLPFWRSAEFIYLSYYCFLPIPRKCGPWAGFYFFSILFFAVSVCLQQCLACSRSLLWVDWRPSKSCVGGWPSVAVNVTLFGNKVFAHVIKLRWGYRVGPHPVWVVSL